MFCHPSAGRDVFVGGAIRGCRFARPPATSSVPCGNNAFRAAARSENLRVPADRALRACVSLPTVRVRGPRVGRDSLLVTGGLSVQVNPHMSGFGSYTGEFLRTNSAVHQMNLGPRAEF